MIIRNIETIYFIEVFRSDPSGFISSLYTTPEKERGHKQILADEDVQKDVVTCSEGHYLRVYYAHYDKVNNAPHLFGPTQRAEVRCPNCEYGYGEHGKFTKKFASRDTLYFVLKTISLSPSPSYHEVDSVTYDLAETFSMLSERRQCPHCGATNYFNYTDLTVNENAIFKGQRS